LTVGVLRPSLGFATFPTPQPFATGLYPVRLWRGVWVPCLCSTVQVSRSRCAPVGVLLFTYAQHRASWFNRSVPLRP